MKRYALRLKSNERRYVCGVVQRGSHHARVVMRAQILLRVHAGKTSGTISTLLGCSEGMVRNVRRRYRERKKDGIESVIADAPRSGQPSKITAAHETFIAATACTTPPAGHAHWTLDALKKTLVETYDDIDSVSHETIRAILIRNKLKPWREKNVVHSEAHT